MLNRIAHLADIHVPRNPARHPEYKSVIASLCSLLLADQPDLIVVAGDLFHDYIASSNEATLLAGSFLLSLSAVAPVVLTRGNHDYDTYRPDRVDSVQTVVDLLDTDRVRYLNRTGFYRVQNLIFAVWHHGQEYSPWNVVAEARRLGYPAGFYADDIEALLVEYGDLSGIRVAGYTFVDLFHDPLTGSQACNGEVFREGTYLGIGDLQGDYAFLGDIHLRQFFTRPGQSTPFAAYPGSLVQQHHGEAMEGHGYIRWDLGVEPIQAVGVDVPSPVKYYTLDVVPGTDYDALDLVLPAPVAESPVVRLRWRDHSLHHTQINKNKLRQHVRGRYGANVALQFDPAPIDQRVGTKGQEPALDLVDVSDAGVQRQLLGEYLRAGGVSESVTLQVQALDEQISERLRVSQSQEGLDTGELVSGHHGEVRLLSLAIDNFQSTEKLSLDFEKLPGILQISGGNETGKTTCVMALMYLCFGNTLGTVIIKNGEVKGRAEKHGDNRFINNKRDLDYCQVSGDFDLGGTLVRATRRTVRTWKRAKAGETPQISKTSTDYRLELLTPERLVDADVSVDKRRRTEQLASGAFGSFDDFLRSCFFSADTMSGLLSLDRAVFVDTILRDVKLDIYELKLKCFREWKSEVGKRQTRLVLDPVRESAEQAALNSRAAEIEVRLAELVEQRRALETGQARDLALRESLPEQFQPEPAATNLSEAEVRQAVHTAVAALQAHGTLEADLAHSCALLPVGYDEARYQYLRELVDSSQGWVKGQELQLRELSNQADTETNQLVHLRGMARLIKERGMAHNEAHELLTHQLGVELANRAQVVRELRSGTVCPTCQQPKTAAAMAAIAVEADRRLAEAKSYAELTSQTQEAAHGAQRAILLQEYRLNEQALSVPQASYEALQTRMAEVQATIDSQQLSYAAMGEELVAVDGERVQFLQRQELERTGSTYPVRRRELEFEHTQARLQHQTYQQGAAVREHNQGIREQLQRAGERLAAKVLELESISSEHGKLALSELPRVVEQARVLGERLAAYQEQLQREQLWSHYEKAINREGLPMQLVRRALGAINEQMAELLDGVCFSIYLDEELEFRMADHRRAGVDQHILQGSGMERTFASLVLRLGLRRLNHRARWNLLVMDELLGKLDAEATLRYVELLRTAAGQVEHVVVIEHHGEGVLRPDHLLRVTASQGVSRYELRSA